MDLGSQTFRLAVASCTPEGIKISASLLKNVRLGDGLSGSGLISPAAMERGMSALWEFGNIIKNMPGKTYINAAGTAALRTAKNSDRFVKEAVRSGIPLRVLTEKEELETAARGVFHTISHMAVGNINPVSCPETTGTNPFTNVLIFDPGGGSTELSLYIKGKLTSWTSIPIGAVNLTERFLHGEIPDKGGIARLYDYADRQISNIAWLESIPAGTLAVATGGTATTAAAMELELSQYEPRRIRGACLSRTVVDSWCSRLSGMTRSEKLLLSGLEPERADIILAGMIIIQRILNQTRFLSFRVSDGGLLLGLLISAIEKECLTYAESSCPRSLYV